MLWAAAISWSTNSTNATLIFPGAGGTPTTLIAFIGTSPTLDLHSNLIVTNIAGDLSEGDSVKIFDAGNCNGASDRVTPSSLTARLEWNLAK